MKNGSMVFADNKIALLLYLEKMDPNFIGVRYLLGPKGKCSHEDIIHTTHIQFVLEANISLTEFKNTIEFKAKYPELFI